MGPDANDSLAALVATDPAAAVAALADRYAPDCYRLAYRLVQDHHTAQDCVQNAFVRVASRIDTWRGAGSLRAWLMRITTNEACRLAVSGRRVLPTAPDPALAAEEAPDPVEGRERADAVRRALLALPPGQRDVLTLRHYAQLPLADIAAERGCAVGTVKATLFQAYAALRRLLPDGLQPED